MSIDLNLRDLAEFKPLSVIGKAHSFFLIFNSHKGADHPKGLTLPIDWKVH